VYLGAFSILYDSNAPAPGQEHTCLLLRSTCYSLGWTQVSEGVTFRKLNRQHGVWWTSGHEQEAEALVARRGCRALRNPPQLQQSNAAPNSTTLAPAKRHVLNLAVYITQGHQHMSVLSFPICVVNRKRYCSQTSRCLCLTQRWSLQRTGIVDDGAGSFSQGIDLAPRRTLGPRAWCTAAADPGVGSVLRRVGEQPCSCSNKSGESFWTIWSKWRQQGHIASDTPKSY
jgi:hypothetical protein